MQTVVPTENGLGPRGKLSMEAQAAVITGVLSFRNNRETAKRAGKTKFSINKWIICRTARETDAKAAEMALAPGNARRSQQKHGATAQSWKA